MDILIVFNTIKLFMVYGVERFYRNYFEKGNDFLNTNIPQKEVKEVIKNARRTLKASTIVKYDYREYSKALVKEILLPPILDYENGKCYLKHEEYMRYIANCIIGNIGDMFEIASEIEKNGKVSQDTIEFAEDNIYASICTMFNYFDLKKNKR